MIFSFHRCTDPLEYRGETLAKVLEDENGFQCPYSHSFTKRGMYGPLVLSTIIVGIILLVAGSVIFAYALYRRTRVSLLSLTVFLCCVCYFIFCHRALFILYTPTPLKAKAPGSMGLWEPLTT